MKPRIRSVKPETFTHELLWLVEQTTGLPIIRSYIALWNMTDRAEVFPWKPRQLKQYCAPYDQLVAVIDAQRRTAIVVDFDFEHVLNALANAGFIFKYIDSGRVYGCVPRFLNHQAINNRETASVLPQPSAQARKDHEAVWLRAESHVNLTRDLLIADAPIMGGGNSAPDNDLDTRERRVGDAPRLELNETELNETEPNGKTPVESTASTSTTRDMPAVIDQQHGDVLAGPAKRLPAVRGKRTAAALVERLGAVLDEVRSGERKRLNKEQLRELQAEFVFTYWANVHGHLNTIMDPKRLQRIVARLAENDGDVSELLYAVDGAKRDKHLMGQNDRDKKFDGIQTIFRDREMIERLADAMPKYRAHEPHRMLAKWGEIVADFNKQQQGASD